jgi:hypothetical protein
MRRFLGAVVVVGAVLGCAGAALAAPSSGVVFNPTAWDAMPVGDMSVPSQTACGSKFTVAVTVRDTGSASWGPHHVVGVGEFVGSGFPISVRPTTEVHRGDEYTFVFELTAPATAGTYYIDFHLNVELGQSGVSDLPEHTFAFGPTVHGQVDVVCPAVAVSLHIDQQPTSTNVGEAISPDVKVSVVDASQQVVANATNSISVTLGNNPGGALLGGITTEPAVNGVATFSGLTLDQPGTGYTLSFDSTGLAGATSDAFNVIAAGSAPVITAQPADQTCTLGGTAAFTAAAVGNPPPTVQWASSTDGGVTWIIVLGGTSPVLTRVCDSTTLNGEQFRATFTNSFGSVTTNRATLHVA